MPPQQADTQRAAAPDALAPPSPDSASAPAETPAATPAPAPEATPAAAAKPPVAEPSVPSGAADPKTVDGPVGEAWAWVVERTRDVTGLNREIASDLLLSLAVVAVLWAARALVLAAARRRVRDVRSLYQWRRWSGYVAVAVGAALFLRIWLGALGGLATFLGLLSAGLAIALREPLVNLAGWVFIIWKRPFVPGDRIGIRLLTGDVIDQRVFQFTLLEVGTESGATQSTGRLIHVPNGWVFADAVTNWTRGFDYIWNEVTVIVTFESNWREAKRILEGIGEEHAGPLTADAERTLRQAAQEYMIFYSTLSPAVYTRGLRDGIELTLRYLVEPRRVRGSEEGVWEAVLDAFAARDDIAFAYPTSRVFRNTEEGKPSLRPPDYVPDALRASDDDFSSLPPAGR